jgi:cell division transport system permease protein
MIALLDSLTTELRITSRVFFETLGGLKRSGWMNMVIIVTMASILTIFGSLTVMLLDSQFFVQSLGNNMEVSVYLKEDAQPTAVRSQLETMDEVRDIHLISKKEAWESMQEVYKDLPEIGNPLPNTFRLKVKHPSAIEATVNQLKAMPSVMDVNYPYGVTQKIKMVTRTLTIFGLVFTLVLGLLTAFIISNTISLLIQARSREIEILRMMGVGNWYIRLPFLFQGAFYGLVSAFLAYLPVSTLQHYSSQAFAFFQSSPSPYSLPFAFLLLMIIGCFVGGGGALSSIHKFLKV